MIRRSTEVGDRFLLRAARFMLDVAAARDVVGAAAELAAQENGAVVDIRSEAAKLAGRTS